MTTMHTDSLLNVLEQSQVRLTTAAGAVTSVKGIAARGAATAALAQESMFAEAMLAAVKARIAESKEVTH
jgi:hypothetical protein